MELEAASMPWWKNSLNLLEVAAREELFLATWPRTSAGTVPVWINGSLLLPGPPEAGGDWPWRTRQARSRPGPRRRT